MVGKPDRGMRNTNKVACALTKPQSLRVRYYKAIEIQRSEYLNQRKNILAFSTERSHCALWMCTFSENSLRESRRHLMCPQGQASVCQRKSESTAQTGILTVPNKVDFHYECPF